MTTDIDPGAVARAEAGGNRVCRGELLDTTNSRTRPTAPQCERRFIVDILKEDALDRLNAAANQLDWLWIHGYEPESLAQIVRDLRSAAVLIRGQA